MQYLKLEDESSNIYTFDESFGFTGMPFNIRSTPRPKTFSDGAVDVADGKIDKRYIILKGSIYGDTFTDYENALIALYRAVSKENQKLYYDTVKEINIKKLAGCQHKFAQRNFIRMANVGLKFLCEDPFWYYKSLSYQEQVASTPPTEFTVNNDGNYEVYPVIKITANANNPSMSVKNKTDNNVLFSYGDGGFISGDQLVVDCKAGTVKLDGVNTIRYFDGQFLRLLAGNNTIEYDGAAATVRFEWYKRYL